jgi:hypothetical protein
LFHAALNCKQKDLKNMLVDNLLPELKLKQSNILTMGDFNFDLQNKNFRFSKFMEHTFSSKQIVSKVTRKYESLLDCISKGLPCQVLPGERLQALWSL